jgi:hypothetical protein
MVLSLELWWARRKLAAKGGMMAKVTWQLLVRPVCLREVMTDMIVDHVPWWNRSHCSSAYRPHAVPISIQRSHRFLLSPYTIRKFPTPQSSHVDVD